MNICAAHGCVELTAYTYCVGCAPRDHEGDRIPNDGQERAA